MDSRVRASFAARAFVATFACVASITAPAVAGTLIHAGDKLEITVYNHSELSMKGAVTSGGDVAGPLGRSVGVAGLTEEQAAARIAAKMTPYLRHPAVSVRLVAQGQSIFVTGFAHGTQPYQPGETLSDAMGAFAGRGATLDASGFDASSVDLRRVRIARDGRIVAEANIEALNRAGDPGPRLEPGDTIMLGARPIRVDVRGDVKSPATLYLYPGETLQQAVEEAGGLSPTTSLTRITLRRAGRERIVSAAGDVLTGPAVDGDVVTLQPAPHVTLLGMVQKPGALTLQSHATLLNALFEAGGPTRDADLRHIKVVHEGEASTVDVYGLTRGELQHDIALGDGDTVFVPQGRRLDASGFWSALGALGSLKYLLIR